MTRHLRSLLGRVEVGVGVHAQAGFARANQFCEHDQHSAGVIMYIDVGEHGFNMHTQHITLQRACKPGPILLERHPGSDV